MIYLIISIPFLFYGIYTLFSMITALLYKAPVYSNKPQSHALLVFYPAYKPSNSFVNNLKRMKEELKDLDASIYVLSQEGEEDINDEIKRYADYFDSKSFSECEGNSYHHTLQYAVSRISAFSTRQSKIQSILLMDPDNSMNRASIERLISGRLAGADVVLSQRKPAEVHKSAGIFDGLSERINDFMFRRSKMVLGLHPELPGSGMLMAKRLFEKAVFALDRKAPGMDKQLLINMLHAVEDLSIVYDENAIVFDEKTEDEQSFNRQRLRWFGNQYYNAKKFGWKLVKSGKPSFIDYAIVLWRPPRSIQLTASTLFIPIDLLLFVFGWIPFPVMSLSAISMIISVFILLVVEGKLTQVVKLTFKFISMSLRNGYTAVMSLSKSNQGTFIHTRIQ